MIKNPCRRPLIFQIKNYLRSDNYCVKYQRFIQSGCKDMRIRKIGCVINAHLFFKIKYYNITYMFFILLLV